MLERTNAMMGLMTWTFGQRNNHHFSDQIHNSLGSDLLAPLGLTYSREDNLINGGEKGALGGEKVKVGKSHL